LGVTGQVKIFKIVTFFIHEDVRAIISANPVLIHEMKLHRRKDDLNRSCMPIGIKHRFGSDAITDKAIGQTVQGVGKKVHGDLNRVNAQYGHPTAADATRDAAVQTVRNHGQKKIAPDGIGGERIKLDIMQQKM